MQSDMKKIPGTALHVQNIFCIGRNYAEHAKELGNPVPAEPVVFLKPTSALCSGEDQIALPAQSARVDHELEVVVAIGRSGKNIAASEALDYVAAIAVGIDLTARDLQEEAKKKALPWALSKGFDTFAPVSKFVPLPNGARIDALNFELRVNGELRQKGSTADMLTSIPKLIEYLSRCFTLSPGDLIFTGTPKGVAPLKSGDQLVAKLEDWTELKIQVR
jgi:2-keto-4-pentenoate hydratase/2-oxohepta-3-ene-1,7-dioic acid hydratase in catechol pathway